MRERERENVATKRRKRREGGMKMKKEEEEEEEKCEKVGPFHTDRWRRGSWRKQLLTYIRV